MFSVYTDALVNNFIDGYELAMARMFNTHQESLFGKYVVKWYFLRKFLVCLWAILFTAVVFNLPLLPERTPSCLQALQQTMGCLGDMAVNSGYFRAMYLSVFVAFLFTKVSVLFRIMDKTLLQLTVV